MLLLRHELKINLKSLLIWSFCIGIMNFGCILLYEGLADTMEQMSEVYAQMGMFSTALGLDRLSVSTMEGFYATEVALIFAVGGAMFAAMTGAVMLSKEEEGHTVEFLHTLPFGRGYILRWKYLSAAALIIIFHIICILWELAGFILAGDRPKLQTYFLFHGAQLLMQLEMGSICFLISSCSKKKQTGAALGIAVLLYLADMMCRILPDIKNLKYLTPYYYSSAADIFANGRIDACLAGIGLAVIAAAVFLAAIVYEKRDLSA